MQRIAKNISDENAGMVTRRGKRSSTTTTFARTTTRRGLTDVTNQVTRGADAGGKGKARRSSTTAVGTKRTTRSHTYSSKNGAGGGAGATSHHQHHHRRASATATASGVDAVSHGLRDMSLENGKASASTKSSASSSSSSSTTYEFAVDAKDARDAQCATEYVREMYHHYRKVEAACVASSTYMTKQTDIKPKMRAILMDWLVEVHLKFKFEMRTLYLTQNIIDRFLEQRNVARQKLQLVGVTAMFLASKYEEICAPEVADFVYLTDNAYTADEILACESTMLNTLNFRLTVPTTWVFLARYCKIAGLTDAKSKLLTRYFAERMLQEYTMLQYLPSKIASAAVYLALATLRGGSSRPTSLWTSDLQRATKYSEATLKQCVRDMAGLVSGTIVGSGSSSLQAVHKKYSSRRYLRVAHLPLPAWL